MTRWYDNNDDESNAASSSWMSAAVRDGHSSSSVHSPPLLVLLQRVGLERQCCHSPGPDRRSLPPQPHLTAGRRRRRRGRTRFISRGTQPRDGLLNGFAYFAMLCSLDLETLYHKTRVRFRVRLLAPHGGIIDSRRQTFLMLEKSAQDEESNFSAKIPWPGDFPWVLC